MWSTSPAERIFRVPPCEAHEVGVGGGVSETPELVWPLGAVLEALPQPAASRAIPATAAAETPDASRPRTGLKLFMVFLLLSLSRGAWLVGRPGVEGVPHAVAEEVEGEHGEDERRAREGEEPPGRVEDRGGLGDHLAPARLGRLDSHAEVGEGRLEQDVLRDDERRVDDDRRDQVGEDLPEEDGRVAGPGGVRRLEKILFAE